MNANYYAVIPAQVRYDNTIPPGARLLYGEIAALANKNGYCFAQNSYFAECYQITVKTVKLWLSALEEKGYIKRVVVRDEKTNEATERRIFLMHIEFNMPTSEEKGFDLGKKSSRGQEKKVPYNNTFNNTFNNKKDIYSSPAEKCADCEGEKPVETQENEDGVGKSLNNNDVKEIVDYLNAQAEVNYKTSTPKTRELIKTRLREGFTVDDFKAVIDKKCADWKNDKSMNKFLRPVTLFGTKFECYLNQKGTEFKHKDFYEEMYERYGDNLDRWDL